MKYFSKLFLLPILLLALLLPTGCTPQAEPAQTASTQKWDTYDIAEIMKYGNLILNVTGEDFLAAGYNYNDMITVEINGCTYTMPVCSNYSDVKDGDMVCRVFIDENENANHVILAVNMGDLATETGIATKTIIEEEPGFVWNYAEGAKPSVRISMNEAGGYADEYALHHLERSTMREDYPHLSDAEFANFRPIATTGIGEHKLYRSSSPINPEIGRNTFADTAVEAAGIRTVINLADTKERAAAYEGFDASYYASCDVVFLDLGIDILAEDFGTGLAEGLRFLAAAEEGPFLVHCTEGKDRAGFVSALLECLMGATAEDVFADYMTTYKNYYGVENDSEQYHYIRTTNIEKTLQEVFNVEDLSTADLAKEAEEYMLQIGLTADEIASIRTKLS